MMRRFRIINVSILMATAIMLSACGSSEENNDAIETVGTAETVDEATSDVTNDTENEETSESVAAEADNDVAEETEENGISPFTIDGITHGVGKGWIEFEFNDDEAEALHEIIDASESEEYETLYDRVMSESLVDACERYHDEMKIYTPMCVIFEDYKVYLDAYKSEDIGDWDATIVLTPIDEGNGYYYSACERMGNSDEGVIMYSFSYGVCPCEQGTFNGDAEYHEHMWKELPDDFDEANPGKEFIIDSIRDEKGTLNNGVRDGEWMVGEVGVSYRGWSDFSSYECKYYSKGRVDVLYEEETEEDSYFEGKTLYYYSVETDEDFNPVKGDMEGGVEYRSSVMEDDLEHLHTFYDDYFSLTIFYNSYGDSNTMLF